MLVSLKMQLARTQQYYVIVLWSVILMVNLHYPCVDLLGRDLAPR